MAEHAVDFVLRGDVITLDALLKATGLASSGGAAKTMIANGEVQVDGLVELRRGRKLRGGEQVAVFQHRIRTVAAGAQVDETALK